MGAKMEVQGGPEIVDKGIVIWAVLVKLGLDLREKTFSGSAYLDFRNFEKSNGRSLPSYPLLTA